MVSVLWFRGAPNKGGGGLALLRGRFPSSPHRLSPELAYTLIRRRFGPRGGMEAGTTTYTFGPYKIDRSEVFYSTPLSYAMVNLRPLLPGHVLVCPRREVKRFVELSADETCDLWLTAKEVGGRLERYHEASSLTFTIQLGSLSDSLHLQYLLAYLHDHKVCQRCAFSHRRMDLKPDRQFHMCIFTFSLGKREILRKMMKFMMQWMRKRRSSRRNLILTRKGKTEHQKK